jgi:hypothetical protein
VVAAGVQKFVVQFQRDGDPMNTMIQKKPLFVSMMAWASVWAFWLLLTHRYHPTFVLALIVTTSLVVAFAAAAYCNHFVLMPRLWATKKPGQYFAWLIATMVLFTTIALAIIRVSYFYLFGPDADPYGLYKHFVIDLFGMIVHVSLAALIVRVTAQQAADIID